MLAPTSPPVLSYSSVLPGATVTIGRYASTMEAALPAAELAAEGIEHRVLNGNVNSLGIPYRGFSDVEIQVHEKDAERATEVLARINADDLEPADDPADALPLDEEGQPLQLASAGAFETARACATRKRCLPRQGFDRFLPSWSAAAASRQGKEGDLFSAC